VGREVKRVALDFEWPLGKVWEGFVLPERLVGNRCPDCEGGKTHFGHWLSEFCHLIAMLGGDVQEQKRGDRLHPWLAKSPRAHGHFECYVGDRWTHLGDLSRGERRAARTAPSRFVLDRPGDDALPFLRGILRRYYEIRAAGDDEYADLYRGREAPPIEEIASTGGISGVGDGVGNVQFALVGVLADAAGVEDSFACPTCKGQGRLEEYEGQFAEADAWEPYEPPAGQGWQMWETVSEGSPASPVFPDAEALAEWLTTTEGGAAAGPSGQPFTIEQARGFVGAGWAPTGLSDASGYHDGAAFVGSKFASPEREDGA
jgi:hypothetical protein